MRMMGLSAMLLAVSLLACTGMAKEAATKADDAKITVTGKVAAGIMAIGGETTGYTISNDKGTWEMAFAKDDLKEKADKLDGKTAKVTGKLEVKEGVEIKERKIIHVDSIEEVADAAGKKDSK